MASTPRRRQPERLLLARGVDADGRTSPRAQTYRPRRGKGSYTRRNKYPTSDE